MLDLFVSIIPVVLLMSFYEVRRRLDTRTHKKDVSQLRDEINDVTWLANRRMAEVVEDTKAFVEEEHQTVVSNAFIVGQRAARHETLNPGKPLPALDADAVIARARLANKGSERPKKPATDIAFGEWDE